MGRKKTEKKNNAKNMLDYVNEERVIQVLSFVTILLLFSFFIYWITKPDPEDDPDNSQEGLNNNCNQCISSKCLDELKILNESKESEDMIKLLQNTISYGVCICDQCTECIGEGNNYLYNKSYCDTLRKNNNVTKNNMKIIYSNIGNDKIQISKFANFVKKQEAKMK